MQRVDDHSAKLLSQVESWRSRLLDIGNRNPLINTSFNPSRGVVEFASPMPEVVWRKLITAGEAGSRALRFPWKRDLVSPPKKETTGDVEQFELEVETDKDWKGERRKKKKMKFNNDLQQMLRFGSFFLP